MQTPSYFFGVVKILENPKQTIFKNEFNKTKFRVLIPQIRKKTSPKIVLLTFWGSLGSDIKKYYQINDYILIEGYLSIKMKKNRNSRIPTFKKSIITVLKVYPFRLKSNNIITKI